MSILADATKSKLILRPVIYLFQHDALSSVLLSLVSPSSSTPIFPNAMSVRGSVNLDVFG